MLPLTDPILVFALLALTMLVMPLLAERLRIPDLVLLLAAGALLGPNGFGVLARNSAVTLFGSVGILYIMFLAGLEIDMHRFARTRGRSVLFGLITFAIPQAVGTLTVRYALDLAWQPSILLASMFASHTLLAYPVASRLGISRREPVAVTVGATIITDMLALLVLAVIADAARGAQLGPGFWLNISGGLLLLVLITWWGIPQLSRWFFNHVTEAGGAQFLFVLVTVCFCAYFSHFAKMEPIIGAFLAGAAFNRLIPEHSSLMSRVVFAGNTLFIPFFLISVGMLVDPGAILDNPRSWLVSAVMILTVIATKYVSARLASALFGYGKDAGHVMFGLSVVQAAATLAAVLVGYNLRILDETALNGAIAMIAVTCPLGAWMVDRYGRLMASEAQPAETRPDACQNILVPVANPAFATKLLDLAFMLRDSSRPGSIHPVTIVRDESDIEEAVARGEKLLAECLTHAAAAEFPVSPTVRIDVNTSDGIIRTARELHISLVITGWGGTKSPSARLFGSVMERLIDTCPSRLLFCRLASPLNTAKRLLLLLPPLSERRSDIRLLLRDAKRLSRQLGAGLQVYLAGNDTSAMRNLFETVSPPQPVALIESPTLFQARTRLLSEITKDDTLLLVGERQGSFLWTPTLDKLASVVIARFPGNNLFLAYPALADYAEEEEALAPNPEVDTVLVCPCELERPASLDEILLQLTRAAFPTDPDAASESLRLLRHAAKSYPVELSGGAVLLHAHCENLPRPRLIVGHGQNLGFFPNLAKAPTTLLALFNPSGRSPERHLKTLADIGRRFRDTQTAEAIRNASSAAEIAELLARPPAKP